MTELLTIESVDEDRALLACRAAEQCRVNGYEDMTREVLTSFGLDRYMTTASGTVSTAIDPQAVAEWMAELTRALNELRVDRYYRNNSEVAERVYGAFTTYGRKFRDQVRNGAVSWSDTPADPSAFTAEDLAARYGLTGAMPRPAGDQAADILASRKEMINAFLVAADKHGPCGEFEQSIRRIGLGKLIPERDVTLTATVPGIGEVTFPLQLSRAGKAPDDHTLRYHVEQAALTKLREVLKDAKVTGLPETATA